MRLLHRLALVVVPALAVAAPAQAVHADARYGLVHGCYELQGPGAQAGPFRMQATALGKYLLYTRDRRVLTAAADGIVAPVAAPSEQGDWRVDVSGAGYTLTLPDGRRLGVAAGALRAGPTAATFSFTKASGCPAYPDSDTDVIGAPTRGPAPWAGTQGLLESHLHWMAFEFAGGDAHCGRPWSPYGVAYAMVDCPDHKPGGAGLLFENILSGRSPTATHDTVGWPTFKDWPNATSLTHEGTYFRWVERAWRGGLRLMVNLFVDSASLCQLWPEKAHNCNEMDTVRLEVKRLRQLQNYVDAQFGGPGRGWLRIVRSPQQARRVINQGKLAVVMGVEISRLFDCRAQNDVPECTRASIERQLTQMTRMGVRSYEIAVKSDNALAGAAGDPGTNGIVTNLGNRTETGHFFDMKTCTGDPRAADKTQLTFGPISGPLAALLGPTAGDQTPVYPPPPHCNTRGLTDLGKYLINRLVDRHLIIDPDHMSEAARITTLDALERRAYSGVISSHSWSTPLDEPRIYKLGGLVIPKASAIALASDPSWFMSEYRRLRKLRDPRFLWGFGYGSDMNGVAKQPVARANATTNDPLKYPFTSFDGRQTIRQATTGKRVWDFNRDGVAQYGLYLDFLEEVRRHMGPGFVRDMRNGPEAYLQMWERAEGIAPTHPLPSDRTAHGIGPLRLGAGPAALLREGGQPSVRGARVWRWPAQGGGTVTVDLSRSGHATAIRVTPGRRVAT
ncbi:MAG: hypothetical protein QOF12_1826 [Solirubrobacteraceae bacterium]|nr:hypothetical protein [Solirubrobacteraceae bacterium]